MAEHWKLQKEREWEEMVKGGHEAKIVKEADEVKKMSSYDRAMSRDTNKAVVEEHKISPGPEYYAGLRHGDWTARLRGHDHAFVQRVSNVNRQELDEESAPDVAHLTAGQLEEVVEKGPGGATKQDARRPRSQQPWGDNEKLGASHRRRCPERLG